jgi:hypothetical protein
VATLESVLGVKAIGLIGGCIGSLIAMSYLPTMTKWQRIGAYASGIACAAYLPPIATYALSLPPSLDGPAGFVAGIAGMGVIGAIIKISRDPIGAWRRFRGAESDA